MFSLNNLSLNREFLVKFCREHLPNRKDNFFQSAVKIVFILFLITAIVFTFTISNRFLHSNNQQKAMDKYRAVWEANKNELKTAKTNSDTSLFNNLIKDNSDFKAWITVGSGKISYPVYQTFNNKYYTNHNFNRQSSPYGALYFDANNKTGAKSKDFNIIINGNNLSDGTLFGELKNYRKLDYFKRNTTVIVDFLDDTLTYKIFAVFLYDPQEDFGFYNSRLEKQDEYVQWTENIRKRSYIETTVETRFGDKFLSLVTDSNEFKGAKTIVVARRVRADETTYVDTSNFSVNPKPALPKKITMEDN